MTTSSSGPVPGPASGDAAAANRFSFKPALLRAPQTVVVDAAGVSLATSQGKRDWQLAWRNIGEVALVDFGARRMQISRFDLIDSRTLKRHAISCTVSSGTTQTSEDFGAYAAAKRDVLKRLADVDPAIPVTIGEYGGARLAGFLVGIACVLAAIVIGFVALAAGRSSSVAGAAIPLLIMLVFGGAVSWAYAPWRRRQSLPVGTIATALTDAEMPDAG